MLGKILARAGLIAMFLASAPFAEAEMPAMAPQPVSLVDAACTQVMGLKPGEYYFAQCRESLARSLAARMESQDMAAAYGECQHQGLQAGSPPFATCMLDAKPAVSAPWSFGVAYRGGPDTQAGKSFYEVAPTVRWNRERYACAQLGLLPGSNSFGQCLSNLDGALMPMIN